MFKIALNNRKPYNYGFFCPVSKLYLTVSNPVGFVHEVTPAIFKGLKYGTLIDVDGTIDLSTGKAKEPEILSYNEPKEPVEEQKIPIEEPKVSPANNNTGKKKRGKRAAIAAPTQDIPKDIPNNI